MLRLLILVFLLVASAEAAAPSANQRAEAEARAYLPPCSSAVRNCADHQRQFVESYVLSEAGITYFMGDIIGFLDPRLSPDPDPSVRPDIVKACAWRYVRWKVAEPPDIADIYRRDWKAHCIDGPDVDVPRQKAEIMALINDLRTAPAVLTPHLAAVRDRFAADEPLTAALIDRLLTSEGK